MAEKGFGHAEQVFRQPRSGDEAAHENEERQDRQVETHDIVEDNLAGGIDCSVRTDEERKPGEADERHGVAQRYAEGEEQKKACQADRGQDHS